MKQVYILLIPGFLILFSIYATAQFDCTNGRFDQEIFSNYDLTSNIQYGQNINFQNNLENLFLDIYEPTGDTASLRPLIIMAHGGNFLGGDKGQADVAPLCMEFAKKGYVTASINYRVGMENFPFPGPDSVDAAEAVFRGTHDARAAVRFFRKDVTENGNTWKIDPNYIFFGGSSAGGFMALHLAYLDDINEKPDYIDTTKQGHGGGIEGNSGNAGYPSTVAAIINIAGALGDTAWMKNGDTPVISFHGDNDQVVPFYSALILLLGQFPLLEVDGSHSVHAKAQLVGIENCFKPFWGQGHTPHWDGSNTVPTYYDTTSTMMKEFLLHYVCNGPMPSDCYQVIGTGELVSKENGIKVYPNPASESINITFKNPVAEDVEVQLHDIMGRLVRSQSYHSEANIRLVKGPLNAGLYFLSIHYGEVHHAQKILFE